MISFQGFCKTCSKLSYRLYSIDFVLMAVAIETVEKFDQLLQDKSTSLHVVHFSAAWTPQCKQMDDVISELAKDLSLSTIKFVKLEAEDVPELSIRYKVEAVPTFIFLKSGQQVDRIDGAHASELTKKAKALASGSYVTSSKPTSPACEDINVRIKKFLNMAPCMLFMKGTVEEPRCGFSKQMVSLLNEQKIKYSTFNILADEEIRQGLKSYSNWPTYPQLYINGELIGGLDIVKEMIANGELDSIVPKKQDLNERLKELINTASVMVFMKGKPNEPRCGFSRTLVELLNSTNVDYKTFDILQDEEVRQGLKTFSDWPTYPQIYVNGELIGGLDIIKELMQSGDLESILKPNI